MLWYHIDLLLDQNYKPDLVYFLSVRLENKFGHLVAFPIQGNGSGDLANLANADGFIEMPKAQQIFNSFFYQNMCGILPHYTCCGDK